MGIFSTSIMTAMLGVAGLGAPPAEPLQWAVRSNVPGGPMCRAEKSGETVDVHIARNNDDKLVLIAGRPDWEHKGGPTAVTISVDGGPPVSLDGFTVGPIVLAVIEDAALTDQLKTARAVTWNLPWGHFTAQVDGLGKALDSIVMCPG